MKAFNQNGKLYKVLEVNGTLVYGEDSKGNVKSFQVSNIEIIEIESMPNSKYQSRKRKEVKADPIQTWKDIALSVNDKWNSNSTWKLAEQAFSKINAKGNSFIESLLDSMFMKDRLSEKQAYYLAKYGVENGYLSK